QEKYLGLDLYTKTVEGRILPVARVAPARRVETAGLEELREKGFAYLLRNASTPAKGLFNPFTGGLFPTQQMNLAEFERSAELIRVWSPAPPETPASFAFVNAELQLYGLQSVSRGLELGLPLTRPVYQGEDHEEAFFSVGHDYGSAHEIVLRRKRKEITVGGPGRAPPPVFLVLSAPAGEPLLLTVRGYGRFKRLDLPAGGVQVVHLERPWWSPRLDKFERIRFKKSATSGGEGRVRVCFDATEVALALMEWGQPGQAETWLNLHPVGGSAGKVLRALIAQRLGPVAASLHEQMKSAARNLEHIASLPAEAYRINGMPGAYYNDFARILLQPDSFALGSRSAGRADLSAPVTLPSGCWRVVLDLNLRGPGSIENALKVTGLDGRPVRNMKTTRIDSERWLVEFDWVTEAETELAFQMVYPVDAKVYGRSVLISWTLADRLRALAAELVSATP
ncbi:MAG: hypothetical protein V2A34_09645, partial [Lentisphaerota bacterium]